MGGLSALRRRFDASPEARKDDVIFRGDLGCFGDVAPRADTVFQDKGEESLCVNRCVCIRSTNRVLLAAILNSLLIGLFLFN